LRRFRFTLLAVCLFLLFLGAVDLRLWLNNPTPAPVAVAELEAGNPPREWLMVQGGTLNLEEAISTSGTVELEALLVPLTGNPGQTRYRILVETRDPVLMELFRTYNFKLDTLPEKERFLEENRAGFHPVRTVEGMVVTGLIASGNRDKLLKLARAVGMDIAPEVIFISEGKTPGKWRGVFFLAAGLLGLARVLTWRRSANSPNA